MSTSKNEIIQSITIKVSFLYNHDQNADTILKIQAIQELKY